MLTGGSARRYKVDHHEKESFPTAVSAPPQRGKGGCAGCHGGLVCGSNPVVEPEVPAGQAHALPATLFAGDWVERTIEIPEAGYYDLVVDGTKSQGDSGRGQLRLDVDGDTIVSNLDGAESTPGTGTLLVYERLEFAAGGHAVRLLAARVAESCYFWPWDQYPTCHDIPYGIDEFWLAPSVTRRASIVLAGATGPGFADGIGPEAHFGTGFIAVEDRDGSLLVGDSANHRIRRVTPDGLVSTLAGSGGTGPQDGPALEASFGEFIHIAPDQDGTFWVLDASPPDPGPGWPKHRDYHVRHVIPADGVTTLWSGRVETGAPPMHEELLQDHGEPFYFLKALVPGSGQSLLIRASYWKYSAVVTRVCGDGMSGRYPCDWYWDAQDVRHLLLVDADGILTNTGETWEEDGPARNEAGVAFFVSGDRLLREPPGGHPQTIHRNPALRAVVSVRDEEVWIEEGARIMRVLDDTHPVFDLHVETVGGAGRVEGVPIWPVAAGATVTLTAVPMNDAQFSHWTGDAAGNNPVIDVRVDRETTVQAHMGYPFEVLGSRVTVTRTPDMSLYPLGTAVTISVVPDAGLDSILWSDGATERVRGGNVSGSFYIGVAGYNSSGHVAATLHTSVLPENSGRVDRTQFDPYYVGTPIWLSAVSFWGYPFLRWSDGSTEAWRVVYAPQRPMSLVAEFDAPPGARPTIKAPGLTETGELQLMIRGKAGLRYGLQRWSSQGVWQTTWYGRMSSTGEVEVDVWIPPVSQMAIYRAILLGD